jgi:GWxTD domain-containing protein
MKTNRSVRLFWSLILLPAMILAQWPQNPAAAVNRSNASINVIDFNCRDSLITELVFALPTENIIYKNYRDAPKQSKFVLRYALFDTKNANYFALLNKDKNVLFSDANGRKPQRTHIVFRDTVRLPLSKTNISVQTYGDLSPTESFQIVFAPELLFDRTLLLAPPAIAYQSGLRLFLADSVVAFEKPKVLQQSILSCQPDSDYRQIRTIKNSDNSLVYSDTITDIWQQDGIDINRLKPGNYKYTIAITANNISRSFPYAFTVDWWRKPFSMSSLNLSFSAMAYLFDAVEFQRIEDLNSGGKADFYQSYWDSKDPDPATAVNELELEFFRRADLVQGRYGTERKYGWEVPSGQAILLYGIPDSTVNIGFTANSGRIFEWYYFNVSQKLIFELKNNEYTLIEIKNLTDEVKID